MAAGGSYTTPGNFTNSGTMDVEQASSLTVAGNFDQQRHGGHQQPEPAAAAPIPSTVTGTLTNNTGANVTIGANNDTSDVANVGLLANSGTVPWAPARR